MRPQLIEFTVPMLYWSLEREVVRHRLHDVLAIVEHAFHRDVVDVGVRSEYICARWNALMRPAGDSMNTLTPLRPRIAYSRRCRYRRS